MAAPAPSSTVPAATAASATGPSAAHDDVSMLKYVQEVIAGTATLLQEIPPEILPFAGSVCKAFLAFEQLVETAKSNKEALSTLCKLCEAVVKGVLDKRSARDSLPEEGFAELKKHVDKAEKVAKLCNGVGIKESVKRFVLARKISNDIAAIRRDVLDFCAVNILVLADDTHAQVHTLATDLVCQLDALKRHTVTQAEYEAMEKEVASMTEELEDRDKKLEIKDILEAELRSSKDALAAMEAELEAKDHRGAEQLKVAEENLEAMKEEVALKTKAMEKRNKELDTRHQNSLDLEAALVDSKETLAAVKKELETLAPMKEQRRVADLARTVEVPSAAPRIPHWYVERTAIVCQACNRLGIGSSMANFSSEEPHMVGLAGPSGAGKSTVASMVIAREDVRASFHKGVLWLQVGQGAKDDPLELMVRLAGMVYETVLQKACRPLREADLENAPEDCAAYIREVVDESSRRFLVVADDVWEMEVLDELRRAGVWVLYTSRRHDLLPEPPLRLDQVLEEEAEMVLRRAADLDDDTPLPEAAYELMRRCEFAVLDLAFVGRWGMARRRKSEMAWRTALERILKAQEEGEQGQLLSWRAAVLRAGLEELACDNTENKELYLALAVIPKGLAFPSEVSRVLLYGDGCSVEDLEAAKRVLETLERWSILTREGGGLYRVHDEHADFMQARFTASQDTRGRTMPRWQYISSARALVTYSSLWLFKSWDVLARVEGEDGTSRPFDAALGALDPSSDGRPAALGTAAFFHKQRKQWSEAYSMFVPLLAVQERVFGVDDLDVAFTLYHLGFCAAMGGKTEEAEQYWRRTLAIQEDKLGADHPDVACTRYSLGLCADKSGRTEEAEQFFRRALSIRENNLGADHPDVAITLQNLGVCVGKAGRMRQAEKYFQRALVIQEDKLGNDHPDVARILHNLGLCIGKAGRTEEAETFFQRALAIREDKLGADHSDVASTLHGLGLCAYRAGRTEEAEKHIKRAHAIEEKLGADYPDGATTLYTLGLCVGRTEEAENSYQRALSIR